MVVDGIEVKIGYRTKDSAAHYRIRGAYEFFVRKISEFVRKVRPVQIGDIAANKKHPLKSHLKSLYETISHSLTQVGSPLRYVMILTTQPSL